jgi:hypothetical protein
MEVNAIARRRGFNRFIEFFTRILSIKKREKAGETKPGIK